MAPIRLVCPTCGVTGELTSSGSRFQLSCRCTTYRQAPTGLPSPKVPRPGPAAFQGRPFQPAARVLARGRALRLWLPRVATALEGPNGRVWKRRAAAAAVWRSLVRDALQTLSGPAPRWDRVRISYVQFRAAGRAMDRDNLVIALGKPVQDALVDAGVLPGDGPDVVVETPSVDQRRSPLPWGFVQVLVSPAVNAAFVSHRVENAER